MLHKVTEAVETMYEQTWKQKWKISAFLIEMLQNSDVSRFSLQHNYIYLAHLLD